MAKKVVTPVVDTQDDLLNDVSAEGTAQTSEGTGAEAGAEVAKTPEELEQERLDAEIKEAQERIKALRAQKKGEKVKTPRTLKGQMVAFKNKAGETVTGLGVLYYVTRAAGGKLHYKEASQVQVLPEGWKEGDAIPEFGAPATEAPAE